MSACGERVGNAYFGSEASFPWRVGNHGNERYSRSNQGVEKGRVEVQGKGGENQRIPFHKINRAVISSGNSVSTTALFWLARAKETTNENRETTDYIRNLIREAGKYVKS